MNGFGFIEYKDPMDARDVVPGKSIATYPFIVAYGLLTCALPLTSFPYVSRP